MTSVPGTSEVEAVLATYDRGRESLIPILQDIQDKLGYLPEDALERIAEFLNLSPNDVFGVATFYAQFRFQPVGKHMIKVCRGTACHVRGSATIMDAVSKKLGIAPRETTHDLEFTLEQVACFGSCALAPVVVMDDKVHARMSPRKAEKIIGDTE
jgi:NADH-quinone oxidoreductase subunit E